VFVVWYVLYEELSSGMLRRVALVRTDVSEERIASVIRVTRIGELGTLAVTNNRRTVNVVPSSLILFSLMMDAILSSDNVGSYKSHMASHPRRRHSSCGAYICPLVTYHQGLNCRIHFSTRAFQICSFIVPQQIILYIRMHIILSCISEIMNHIQ
jgi:hypothetical protein